VEIGDFLHRVRRSVRRRRIAGDAEAVWFWDHYELAADEIISFLGGFAISLAGRRVADVGCGDGIMALGVFNRARPAELVGYDVIATPTDLLLRRARKHRVADALPAGLSFELSEQTRIPAEDSSFDVVYTWSAFEHVLDPPAVLREIRRILKPEGVLFLQLWPFYYSERGSHLWDWFPDGFHHLLQNEDEIVESMRSRPLGDPGWTDQKGHDYRTLNRVTLDELGEHLDGAGFDVTALEPLVHRAFVPRGLSARYPLSSLGIAGVKLLAVPRPETV
jgi:SAM-dependent methyltransferase